MENKKNFEDITRKADEMSELLANKYSHYLLFAATDKHGFTITNQKTYTEIAAFMLTIIQTLDQEHRDEWFDTLATMAAVAMQDNGKARNTMRSILKNCPGLAQQLGVEIKPAKPGEPSGH